MYNPRPCNKENMQKLVDALRSGNYEQCSNHLRIIDNGRDRYCCLGVACDLSFPTQEKGWGRSVQYPAPFGPNQEDKLEVYYVFTKGYDQSRSFKEQEWGNLPKEVQDWLGISECDPQLQVPDRLAPKLKTAVELNFKLQVNGICASRLNDTFRFSFAEIADCFEHTYLKDMNPPKEEQDNNDSNNS